MIFRLVSAANERGDFEQRAHDRMALTAVTDIEHNEETHHERSHERRPR